MLVAAESKLTRSKESTRMTELVTAQGAGTLVARVIEATVSTGDDIELHKATLYDCAVVVFYLASAALSCAAPQGDLVGEGGEGGVLLVLATVAKVRWVGLELNGDA